MSNLKILRTRLKTIKTTQKITKAMQMVAASKLKKIRPSILPAKTYFESSKDALYSVINSIKFHDLDSNYAKFLNTINSSSNNVLMILYASQKGLCGSFNMLIIKKMLEDINKFNKLNTNLTIVVVGKRGYDTLKSKCAIDNIIHFDSEFDNIIDPTNFNVYQLIVNLMIKQTFDQCWLYYNIFKNPLIQIPTKYQLFPIQPILNKSADSLNNKFEVEGKDIVANLFEHYIKANLRYAYINSIAGEEGAKMNAMDNANRNAEKISTALTLKLNRSRQEIITRELIEIISGAEALSN